MSGKRRRTFKTAEDLAVFLLTRRDYSSSEIKEKLQIQGFTPGEVETTVQALEARGILNDGRYARRLAESLTRHKLLGPEKIRQKLLQKGIVRELADQAVENVDVDSPVRERIRLLLESKWKHRDLSAPGDKRKAAYFLYRRGFFWEDIIAVLKEKEDLTENDDR